MLAKDELRKIRSDRGLDPEALARLDFSAKTTYKSTA
jgi:hypothetical protein